MENEILTLMIVNLPNFMGFFVGIILMWRIVMYLLEDNSRCRDQLSDKKLDDK